MKREAVFTAGVLLVAFLASAQGLSKEAKIERILALTYGQAAFDQIFEQMKTQMIASASSAMPSNATPEQRAKAQELQIKIWELMKTRMSWEKMKPEYAKLYSETFSDDEVDGMLAFYESPAGRAMQAKMPMLMSKVMALAQSQMGELLPEIQRITKEVQQK
jgi:hypothetical protein